MDNNISKLTLFNPSKLRTLLSLGFKGYLADVGWFKALETKSAVDEHGEPIPWVTYSFIDFIKDRIGKQHDIFEFGCGNSTLFYAKHAKSVTSVEHDKAWFERNANIKLPNVKMIYCELVRGGDYSKSAVTTEQKFNIIIVDGRDRVNCCKESILSLTEDGIIVLDNSERPDYAEAFTFFKEKGFKHLPFTGMSPGVTTFNRTSVFYKSNNCLGI